MAVDSNDDYDETIGIIAGSEITPRPLNDTYTTGTNAQMQQKLKDKLGMKSKRSNFDKNSMYSGANTIVGRALKGKSGEESFVDDESSMDVSRLQPGHDLMASFDGFLN